MALDIIEGATSRFTSIPHRLRKVSLGLRGANDDAGLYDAKTARNSVSGAAGAAEVDADAIILDRLDALQRTITKIERREQARMSRRRSVRHHASHSLSHNNE